MLTVLKIACLLNAVTSLLLGCFVVFKNRKSTLNVAWSLTCLSIGIWALGLLMVISSNDYKTAFFWLKMHYLGAFFIPPNYLFFILSFFKKSQEYKRILLSTYLIGILFFVVDVFFNLVSKNVSFKFYNSYYTDAGILFLFFIAEYFLVAAYAHYYALKNLRNLNIIAKRQIRLILIGSIIGFLGGGTTIFPVLNWGIYPFGTPLVFIYTILVYYAITKHSLMDIRIVINRIAAYIMAISLFAICCGLIINYYSIIFMQHVSLITIVLFLILIVFTGLAFHPLRLLIQTTPDKFLFRKKYVYEQAIRDISHAFTEQMDVAQTIELFKRKTREATKAKTVGVWLADQKDTGKSGHQ